MRQSKTRSLDFALLFAFLIFSLIPFGPQVWFLIPAAVCVSYNTASRWPRWMPWVAFVLGLYILRHDFHLLTRLDLLAYVLLFLFGAILVWCRREKRNFISALFGPFAIAGVGALVVLASYLKFTPNASVADFLRTESSSLILPHFFHRETWVISKDFWSSWSLDFFDSILVHILREGVLGWFAATLGFAYFINGTIETMIRGFRTPQPKKRLRLWAEFNAWKAPEWVLWGLFAGLLVLAFEMSIGHRQIPLLRVLGWTLAVISLFPIFCQGICFASFLIPRASFLPFVIIFALLIINPVPVLLLAGLADLWFDLRSRMSSSPEV